MQVAQIQLPAVRLVQNAFENQRDDADGVDLFPHQTFHIVRNGKLLHQNQRAAGGQREICAGAGRVEELGDELIDLSIREGQRFQHALQLIEIGAVGINHAFGPAGRAAGVHVIRGVAQCDFGFNGGVRLPFQQGIEGGAAAFLLQTNEADSIFIMPGQFFAPFGLFRLEEGTGHLVQIEQIFHLLRRKPPIEFHGDCAELFDGHFRDHEFRAVARDDGYAVTLPDAETAQVVRRLVDQSAQLRIGDAPITEDDGFPFRAAGEGFVQDLTDAGVFLEST